MKPAILTATAFALAACGGPVTIPVVVPLPNVSVPAQVRPIAEDTAQDAVFHKLINDQRRDSGLQPVAANDTLAKVARAHAADMVARNYFSHTAPDGTGVKQRATAAGIPACGFAENIAFGQDTSAEVFAAWMTSDGHRANMLNRTMRSYGLGRAGDRWVLMLYAPC